MKCSFPNRFLWGTSTSAFQIETAYDHDWKGLIAKDGSILEETIFHELCRENDAKIISGLGNSYRCSLDWSRIQQAPKAHLETKVIDEYRNFLGLLKDNNTHIMLVLHHYANPNWFAKKGAWISEESIEIFKDYASQVSSAFGDLTDSWNTINEPEGIVVEGYVRGRFPPHHKNIREAYRVLKNLRKAHTVAYSVLKEKVPNQPVGVSNPTMVFHPETIFGLVPAKFADFLFLNKLPVYFSEVDFVGVSYYGKVPFKPGPLVEYENPGVLSKLGKKHDKMWEYFPEGLYVNLIRLHNRYQKPIIITENGCCTDDDKQRQESILSHLFSVHRALQYGVDVRGYFHWSTFDNFELHLGRSYRFGLYSINERFERIEKESARLFRRIAEQNAIEI